MLLQTGICYNIVIYQSKNKTKKQLFVCSTDTDTLLFYYSIINLQQLMSQKSHTFTGNTLISALKKGGFNNMGGWAIQFNSIQFNLS